VRAPSSGCGALQDSALAPSVVRGDLVVSVNDCPVEDQASWTACLEDMYGARGGAGSDAGVR